MVPRPAILPTCMHGLQLDLLSCSVCWQVSVAGRASRACTYRYTLTITGMLQLLSQRMQMLRGLVWLVCVLGCVVWSGLDGLVCKLGTTNETRVSERVV